jgi:hypothetical protein
VGDFAAVTGLDWPGALACLPADLPPAEREQVLDALRWIEAGALEGDGARVSADAERVRHQQH